MQQEPAAVSAYHQDGLWTIHNHAFMHDPAFARAYQRGVQAAGKDYKWHWRVHVGLWAATSASRLEGDFVECGVNHGCLSSAIMTALDWNSQDRQFFLLDTFAGVDARFVTEGERRAGILEKAKTLLHSGVYTDNLQRVHQNFSEWRRIVIIQGAVPETLNQVATEAVAFLHLDMNCALPEVAALEYFWELLVPGALVLLDDYAYQGFESQKQAMDFFAAKHAVPILSLPTGQGLIIKPPPVPR